MKGRPYNLVLLSAHRNDATDKFNTQANVILNSALKSNGFLYEKAEGQYEGEIEPSYAVKISPPIDDTLAILKIIAFNVFNQDSILLIDSQNQATLIFKDGKEYFIGVWTESFGKLPPTNGVDYTKIGDRYFVVQ